MNFLIKSFKLNCTKNEAINTQNSYIGTSSWKIFFVSYARNVIGTPPSWWTAIHIPLPDVLITRSKLSYHSRPELEWTAHLWGVISLSLQLPGPYHIWFHICGISNQTSRANSPQEFWAQIEIEMRERS